jgi:NAD(P)-dependent dehydrogenase (short-subunit alcohol dehydrogenase family)
MLDPIDLANAVVFLASDEARHVNGAVLAVDMGWRAA